MEAWTIALDMRDVDAALYLNEEELCNKSIKGDSLAQGGIDMSLLTQAFRCLSPTVLFVLFKLGTGN